MAIPMLKIRRPNGRLIFNMEIAIRRLDGLYIYWDGALFPMVTLWLLSFNTIHHYRKTSDISRILLGNKIVHHSGVSGASPIGIAPTKFLFSVLGFGTTYIRGSIVTVEHNSEM